MTKPARFQMELSPELHERIGIAARRRSVSMGAFVRMTLSDALDRDEARRHEPRRDPYDLTLSGSLSE